MQPRVMTDGVLPAVETAAVKAKLKQLCLQVLGVCVVCVQ